jgi:hypothetical protein
VKGAIQRDGYAHFDKKLWWLFYAGTAESESLNVTYSAIRTYIAACMSIFQRHGIHV